MDINSIREDINKIDGDILKLFEKRMNLAKSVAEYKKENNMPVFQSEREVQVINRIQSMSSEEFSHADKILFNVIMDLSKCIQKNSVIKNKMFTDNIISDSKKNFDPNKPGLKVACPGVAGAYSHIACEKMFPNSDIKFCSDFEDVFEAVGRDEVCCGVLPVENSNAGSVLPVYELLDKFRFYIIKSMVIKIEHCLAAKNGIDSNNAESIYSHPQAIAQCRQYLRKLGIDVHESANTSTAAVMASESNKPIAVICSKKCAKIYNLNIVEENIQDESDNYTRFITVSKSPVLDMNANTVTVSIKLPHVQGALYRFLTTVAVNNVNMTRIESIPAKTKNFDVVFYIDFEGNIKNTGIINLLNDMHDELSYCRYIGNYPDLSK